MLFQRSQLGIWLCMITWDPSVFKAERSFRCFSLKAVWTDEVRECCSALSGRCEKNTHICFECVCALGEAGNFLHRSEVHVLLTAVVYFDTAGLWCSVTTAFRLLHQSYRVLLFFSCKIWSLFRNNSESFRNCLFFFKWDEFRTILSLCTDLTTCHIKTSWSASKILKYCYN